MMIRHLIHFYQKGLYYTWELDLPYRLMMNDQVHYELLFNQGKLQYEKEIDDKFYEIEGFDEHLIVEDMQIDHNGWVVAWMNIYYEDVKNA